MTHNYNATAKNSRLYQIYLSFANKYHIQRMRRDFWKWSAEDQRRMDFYRQFIAARDLVFDVGANMGNRTKVFHKLGAFVVAIEPQMECADFLQSVFQGRDNIHLVRKALGASPGEAEMLICTANTISSLSSDWIHAVKQSGRFTEYEWNRKQIVSMDTLDNLIVEFGNPAFVKIDVEGFEDQVIAGLSTPVGFISIEFVPEYRENADKCLRHLRAIGEPRFNISLGESMQFNSPEWASEEEIIRGLAEINYPDFADIYVRFDPK